MTVTFLIWSHFENWLRYFESSDPYVAGHTQMLSTGWLLLFMRILTCESENQRGEGTWQEAEEAVAQPAPQSLLSNLFTGDIQTTLSCKRDGEGSVVSILLFCEMPPGGRWSFPSWKEVHTVALCCAFVIELYAEFSSCQSECYWERWLFCSWTEKPWKGNMVDRRPHQWGTNVLSSLNKF